MSIHVIKPGLQTSIQDLGRPGQMHNGIARSGAMDPVSMQIANWLVNNPANNPVIEVTLVGPTLQFETPLTIAISGADFDLYLNGDLVFNNQSMRVNAGDLLEFDRLNSGARAYIAIAADFKLTPVLNSFSTHLSAGFGGLNGRAFMTDDQIPLSAICKVPMRKLADKNQLTFSGSYLLRCVPSVESAWFSQAEHSFFYSQQYQVTPESNRMGIRLRGTRLTQTSTRQMVSSGLLTGSIQIPQSGLPIISSVDGQTIGGYPRIANVVSADQSILGQLKANDKIRFVKVNQKQAVKIIKKKQALLTSVLAERNNDAS